MANKRGNRLPTNYNTYQLTPAQIAASAAAMGIAALVILYIFYMNIFIALLGLLLCPLGPRIYRKRLIARRKSELNVQFKDFLYALNSSIGAGKSLDDALLSARESMRVLYMDDSNILIRELDGMAVKLQMRTPATELLSDLAHRSGNEDIQSFATVLASGSEKGIDHVELIQKTVRVITEKLEIKQEIETKVASVKLEQYVLMVMPVVLMLMMNCIAPDYMQTLYDSPTGYLIITVALLMLGGAFALSNRIMNIKV